MISRNDKFVVKLQKKIREHILETIEKILNNNLEKLDIKKLRGSRNLYRVRVSNIRIVFVKGFENRIIFVGKRGDKTYKDF